MPGPARAGALIYAKDMARMSAFYQSLLSARLLASDDDHHVLESDDIQLVIHAIPAHIASTFEVATPPVPREEQAIKLFFSVLSLPWAAETVSAMGGAVFGPTYAGPGFNARNGIDPEGNVFHVRAWVR